MNLQQPSVKSAQFADTPDTQATALQQTVFCSLWNDLRKNSKAGLDLCVSLIQSESSGVAEL